MQFCQRIGTLSTIAVLLATASLADEVTFTGTVVRASDGTPVTGAVVGAKFWVAGDDVWADAETDDAGRFELRHDGNGRPTFLVAVADGLALGAAVTIPGRSVTIEMSDDPGAITGTVLSAGEPVEGAEVIVTHVGLPGGRRDRTAVLYGWERAPRAATDAEGRFEIGGLPRDGVISLRVSAPGWAAWRIGTTADRIRVGGEATIRLQPEAVIEGRVVRDGQPVAGIRVRAEPEAYRAVPGEAVSAEDGAYRIGGLGEDQYRVQADAPEGMIAMPADGVLLRAGETASGVDVELVAPAAADGPVVQGTVWLMDTGEPAVGARIVGGRPEASRAWNVAVADDDGRFALRLPEGPVVVGYEGNLEGYPNEWAEPRMVELMLGPDGAQATFYLRPTSMLTATVVDPDGEPVPHAEILGFESSYGPAGRDPLIADEQGRYSLPRVSYERMLYVTDPAQRLCALAMVPPEHEIEFWVHLQPAAWAEAQVVDTQGRPMADVSVIVQLPPPASMNMRDIPATAASDADGRLRIGPLPAGVPMVIEPSWPTQRMLVEDVWEPLGELTFAVGETRELPTLVLNPDGRGLEGIVVDLDGQPVAGATVLSLHGVDGLRKITTSGEDGTFRLEHLRVTGRARVVAFEADGSRAWGMSIELPAAFRPEFMLEPAAAMAGVVLGRDGAPRPGCIVTAVTYDLGATHALPDTLTTHAVTRAGDDGRWRVEGLIPGLDYRAHALDPETQFPTEPQRVMVGGRETPELELRLGQ